MKKIIRFIPLLYSCIFASFVMSQSLEITTGSGKIIPNDTTIYINGDTSSGSSLDIYAIVKNISSSTVTVKAKEIANSLVPGAKIALCFQVCSPAQTTSFTSPYSIALASNASDNTFAGHYYPYGHTGESIITFVFYNNANKHDSVGFVVHFNATPAGIKPIASVNAEISNPYPNPTADLASFNYSLPNNTDNARLVITNILGSVVKEIYIANKGTLNVNTS